MQVLQSKAMTKVKSQNTKMFKEYNVMTEKMTVIRVVRDAQTRRRVAECTNGKQKVLYDNSDCLYIRQTTHW